MFSTTRGRLVLIQVAVLAVAVAVADFSVYRLVVVPAREQVDNSLYGQAFYIREGLAEENGAIVVAAGQLPERTDAGVAVAAAGFDGPRILAQTSWAPLPPEQLVRTAASVPSGGYLLPEDQAGPAGEPYRVYAERVQVGSSNLTAVVIVYRPMREVRNGITRLYLLLALGSLLALALAAVLANHLVGRAMRPVTQIAGVARGLSDSGLFRRVEISATDDELAELVDTFNGMLTRLQSSFDSLRRFTADASHELRAPLTVMRSEVEVALARDRTPEEYKLVLQRVADEINHLARIMDQLLILARADAGALDPTLVPLDVADFVNEVGARWTPLAEKRGLTVNVEAPDSGQMLANQDLTRRILDNLLENAIRQSPVLGTIRLRAELDGAHWAITVADQGPGIPQEYRPALFERFARPDRSRARRAGGAGLGLALSAAVARAQGGTLELVSEPGWGAVFRLRLPITGRRVAVRV